MPFNWELIVIIIRQYDTSKLLLDSNSDTPKSCRVGPKIRYRVNPLTTATGASSVIGRPKKKDGTVCWRGGICCSPLRRTPSHIPLYVLGSPLDPRPAPEAVVNPPLSHRHASRRFVSSPSGFKYEAPLLSMSSSSLAARRKRRRETSLSLSHIEERKVISVGFHIVLTSASEISSIISLFCRDLFDIVEFLLLQCLGTEFRFEFLGFLH